jgi:hypothetical protein
MSSVRLGGAPSRDGGRGPAAPSVATRPGGPPDGPWRGTPTLIAGVGVLLLAMGVGVLIGRSGASKPAAAPAQVISVATAPSTETAVPASGESSFADDWPSGTSGFTVALRTLPRSGTAVSAVEAAKTAASAKGATGVGALKSDDFRGLAAGEYVIYSGVYHKRADAEKALSRLKKSFPGASVIKVASGSAGANRASSGSSGGRGGVGSSLSKPAPPTVLQGLSKKKGQSYEQESKNLPNVVSTG